MYKPEMSKILAALAKLKLTAAESSLIFAMLSRPPATEPLYSYSSDRNADAVYRVGQLTDFYDCPPRYWQSEKKETLTWLSCPGVYKASKSLIARGLCGSQYQGALYLCLEKIVPPPKAPAVKKAAKAAKGTRTRKKVSR